MRLVEIQDGISINTDKIDGVERVDDTSCKVYVGKNTYLATVSYETLMGLLRNEEIIDKGLSRDTQFAKTMDKLDKILNTTQFTAL